MVSDTTGLVMNPRLIQYTSKNLSIYQRYVYLILFNKKYMITSYELIFFRWNFLKGSTVDPSSSFWQPNEPDIKEFDYTTRQYSPLTKEGFDKCSSNPLFSCSVREEFSCNSENNRPGFTFEANIGQSTTCDPESLCDIENNNQLFVKFDLVKRITKDAEPACMAITSPNVMYEENGGPYDTCSLLFDFTRNPEEYEYAKFVDLKCNQATRALMCTTLGRFIIIFALLIKTYF